MRGVIAFLLWLGYAESIKVPQTLKHSTSLFITDGEYYFGGTSTLSPFYVEGGYVCIRCVCKSCRQTAWTHMALVYPDNTSSLPYQLGAEVLFTVQLNERTQLGRYRCWAPKDSIVSVDYYEIPYIMCSDDGAACRTSPSCPGSAMAFMSYCYKTVANPIYQTCAPINMALCRTHNNISLYSVQQKYCVIDTNNPTGLSREAAFDTVCRAVEAKKRISYFLSPELVDNCQQEMAYLSVLDEQNRRLYYLQHVLVDRIPYSLKFICRQNERSAVMCAENSPNSNLFYEVSCNSLLTLNKTRHVRDDPSIIGTFVSYLSCSLVNGYQTDLILVNIDPKVVLKRLDTKTITCAFVYPAKAKRFKSQLTYRFANGSSITVNRNFLRVESDDRSDNVACIGTIFYRTCYPFTEFNSSYTSRRVIKPGEERPHMIVGQEAVPATGPASLQKLASQIFVVHVLTFFHLVHQ